MITWNGEEYPLQLDGFYHIGPYTYALTTEGAWVYADAAGWIDGSAETLEQAIKNAHAANGRSVGT